MVTSHLSLRETPLPPIADHGFQYGLSGFTVTGISRSPLPSLRILLFPKGKKETKSAESHRFTKKWLVAQLKLYGVQFKTNSRIDELKKILKGAIANGQCDSIPERILSIERGLEKRYTEANAKHIDEVRNIEETEFAEIYDDLFALADDNIDLSVEREEELKEEDNLMQHKELVKEIKKKGKKAYDPKGVYSVNFPNLADQYDEGPDGLQMTIMWDKELGKDPVTGERRLRADFDFNILEGIMRFRREGEEAMLEDDDEDDEDDEYEEDEEIDHFESPPPPSGSKRKRNAAASGSNSRPAKKTKAPKTSLKLLLNWRGSETGEGEIQIDYDDTHTGWIQFTDETCTAFKGKISMTYLKKNSEFSGRKVDYVGEGESSNRRWRDYSKKAYEYARVNRWR